MRNIKNCFLLLFASILIPLASLAAVDIPPNKYGLPVISQPALYQQTVAVDGQKKMVDLEKIVPAIKLELIFATDKHFVKKKLYPYPKAYLRAVAAEALVKVQQELLSQNLRLKIWDAYRPYSATEEMWELIKDDRYVADPSHGSKHNRGCAVDLTLVHATSGREVEMPTPYLDFTEKAHHSYTQLSEAPLKNRSLLKTVMEKHGFLSYEEEWWHYNFKDWEQYELLNLSFDELSAIK